MSRDSDTEPDCVGLKKKKKKPGSVAWQAVKSLCLGFSWEDELML